MLRVREIVRHQGESLGGRPNSDHNSRRRSGPAVLPLVRNLDLLPEGRERVVLQLLRRRQEPVPGSDLVRTRGRWHPRVRLDDPLPHQRRPQPPVHPQVGEAGAHPGSSALPREVRAPVSRDTDELAVQYQPGEGRKAGTDMNRAIREAPAARGEVILSQAESGPDRCVGVLSEGAEARSVTPKNNPIHERPALGEIRDDKMVRHSGESRRVRLNSAHNSQGDGVLQADHFGCSREPFGVRDNQGGAVHSRRRYPGRFSRVLARFGREAEGTPKSETRDVQ